MSASQFSKDDLKQMKVPPHSIEAEQSVIGGLMLDNEVWDAVAEKVTAVDFYRRDHRIVFRTIEKLAENDTPFDVITLCDALESAGELEHAGGLAYLSELAKNTPSVANVGAYAEIIRERSILRQLLDVARDVADKVYNPEGEKSQALLDEAERRVFAIAESGQRNTEGPIAAKNIVPNVVEQLDQLMQTKDGITGLETGYADLNAMTSGLQPADLVIVAGRPSMGKTTFAMNMAEHVAMDNKKPVLMFSMEMPKESIMMRTLSSFSRVDQTALRSGQLTDHDWSSIFSSMSIITEHMNLYIDDTAALSPSEMRSRARRLAREHNGLSMIVVDYLQLMQVPGVDNRVNEVSEISRNLKALAKELNVPVVALSQLSRKSEDRNDKRPMMSDLRESGAIEQDADVIMFVYRDEVYNPESEHKGTAEIIIGKQRNGPIGMVRLTFLGQYCRFDDYAAQQVSG